MSKFTGEGNGGGQRMNAAAVRVPKTAELVARQIRNAIIRGEIGEGDTLPPEMQLIADFKVSRPTLREAIRILESEGLLDVARGARGGASVRPPDHRILARAAGVALQAMGATIGDLYEMRTLIEPPAARLVAERNAEVGARILREHLEKELATVENSVAASAAIAQFHRLMIEQSGNVTLITIALALQNLVERHLDLAQARESAQDAAQQKRRLRLGFKSHARLIELIEAGDGPGAEAHWRDHMVAAGRFWLGGIGPASILDLLE